MFNSDVRYRYFETVEGKINPNDFIKSLESEDASSLLDAYHGAAVALKAKSAFMPFDKLAALDKALVLLNKAITGEPENAEIRMLRFFVEQAVPGFLGKTLHLEEDIKVILEGISSILNEVNDSSLSRKLVTFLLKSEKITTEEKTILETSIAV